MSGDPSAPVAQLLPCPLQVQISGPQVHPSPVNSAPELYSFKNKLQEHAQQLSLKFPVYETINEGSQHEPQFRSVVFVDGKHYKSTGAFPQRKLAEQNAAKVALDDLSQKIKEDGRPLICEDTTFCKSILHEYADKMHIEKPKYHTMQQEGILPAFLSFVNFNGVHYNGGTGKNKKEAEQLAARAAILSVIDSDPDGIICKIIKSKVKLYVALNKMKDDGSGVFSNERKEAEASVIDINLPLCGNSQPTSSEINEMRAAVESFHKFKKHKSEISNVEVAPPIVFVRARSQQPELPSTALQLQPTSLQLPSSSLQLPSASLQVPSTSIQMPSALGVKQSRKSRKKNKKRSVVDAQMPADVLPLRQIPPCSVAQ